VAVVDHLTGYGAFVVGSAVYAAHWQEASAVTLNHCTVAMPVRSNCEGG
jgi:hypothetical protein